MPTILFLLIFTLNFLSIAIYNTITNATYDDKKLSIALCISAVASSFITAIFACLK